ncbi:MAG: type II toxin-antitoxin system HicB family antitoxin [Gaiellaceae bacterium]
MELHATVHQEDGSYWAEVRELPGCFASGHTLDEVIEGLREAIAMCLPGEGDHPGQATVRLDELKLITA